jgi:hypothetical protein
MKIWTIWQEGYVITGNTGKAFKVGTAKGDSFEEACISLCKDNPYFNPNTLRIWGCRLFDKEHEARDSFG